MPQEFLTLDQSHVQAVITEVPSTTDVYDSTLGRVPTKPVPGRDGETYVPHGENNDLPQQLKQLIDGDEVTAQCIHFNVTATYGAGLQWETIDNDAPHRAARDKRSEAETQVSKTALRAFVAQQSLETYLLEQATDMAMYFFCVSVVILSQDGRRINRIVHKEAPYVRLAQADRTGRIPFIYYADWYGARLDRDSVERIALLDHRDPLGDLRTRLGLQPDPRTGRKLKPTSERKFAILSRFPTAGNQYYPVPYWTSILRGGSYDEKRLISVGKRAKLRNHTSVKYHVEIERDYWDKICREEFITAPEAMQARIKQEKENIRKFLSGIENANKVWISSFYVNPDGREVRDVRISLLEGQKEGGDWNEDVQAAANTICFAFGVHPNLVGAVPGKSQQNNSGSDKRELYTMKQALLTPTKHLLLRALNLCCAFNGFGVRPTLPMVQLTTLDTHQDAIITD